VSDPAAAAPLPSRTATDDSTKEQSDERQRSNYSVNTNLEQISDWLTKIIVGVGLTELPTIRAQFYNIADYFGKGFGSCGPGCPREAGAVGAAVIMIYGLTAGFLAGYLFTRMFLPGAFRRADAEAKLRERLKDAFRRADAEAELRIEQRTAAETAGRVQGEIYEELYKYNEQGFRQVIEKLDELLKSEVNRSNPALFVYLAAAHGQAYSWADEHETDPEKKNRELAEHRAKALQAVKDALHLGDSWKPILQVMWDPHHPVKSGSESEAKYENDLEPFYSADPQDEFYKLLAS
jgi:hypothetical protein